MILDLGLPDEDGLQLLTRIRSQGKDLPVLILSACDTVLQRVAGLQAGADDYLPTVLICVNWQRAYTVY